MSDDQREAEHVILRGERDGICFEILLGGIIRIIADGTVIQKGPREWFQSAYRHEGMPSSAAPEALRSGETPRTDAFSNPSTEGDEGLFVSVETYNALLESHGQLERELVDEIRTVDALQKEIERLLSIPSPLARSQEKT